MITFPEDIRYGMFYAAAGYCQCSPECAREATEFDHILPNTKTNQKLFPLFLQSPFNCRPINQHCHKEKGKIHITYAQAEVFEKYLQGLKNGI